MRFVSHMVLGAPIILTHIGLLEVSKNFPRIPDTSRRKCTIDARQNQEPCMLLPLDAEFFSVVVDRVGGLYVRPQCDRERIYCLQPQFASLSRLLPGDSACRAIAYSSAPTSTHDSQPMSDAGVPVLGVYDLTRLEGKDLTHLSILQRHELLHKTVMLNFQKFEEYTLRVNPGAQRMGEWNQCVRVHWVGWQEACVKTLETCKELPFKTSHICRLDEDQYFKMLTPITTMWT